MDLFENYIKQASKYLKEDEEDIEILDDVEEDTPVDDIPAEEDEGAGEEEVLELDLANPVCPSCGAKLVPVEAQIDTEDEDLGLEEDEADAINLLQGLGYIVYKPTEEGSEDGEPVDDDFPSTDDEDFNEDDETAEAEDDFVEDED
jgi:hypothetical protein